MRVTILDRWMNIPEVNGMMFSNAFHCTHMAAQTCVQRLNDYFGVLFFFLKIILKLSHTCE